MTSTCRRCNEPIDREKLRAELSQRDIPTTAARAAAASVCCSFICAIEHQCPSIEEVKP